MARSNSKLPAVGETSSDSSPLLDEDVLEFIKAIDDYRRKNNRPFPTWSEILVIVHSLGYKKNEGQDAGKSEG